MNIFFAPLKVESSVKKKKQKKFPWYLTTATC